MVVFGNLHGTRKNILLGVTKVKISLQTPKTEFDQFGFGRMICPSTRNVIWSKTMYIFGGQNKYGHVIYPLIRNKARQDILLGVKKGVKK
jgi:hypothetical protein